MFRAKWIPVFRFYSQLWPVIDEVNFSNRRIKWLYDFPKLVFPIQNIDWRCALSMRSRPHNAVLLFNNPQMLIAYKAKLALYFVFITIYYMSVAAFAYSTWLLTLGPFLKKKTDIWHMSCGLQMVSRETKLQRLTIWPWCTHTASTPILMTNASQWMGSVFSFCKRRRLQGKGTVMG